MRPYREQLESTLVEKENGSLGWLTKLRQAAYRRFQEQGFPTRKLEAWKYLPLDLILNARFAENDESVIPAQAGIKFDSRFSAGGGPAFGGRGNDKNGVILEDLDRAIESRPDLVQPYLAPSAESEPNAFVSINTFSFKQGVFLFIPDGVTLPEPIHLLIGQSGPSPEPQAFHPRILVVAGADAHFSLIMDYVGFQNEKFLSNTVAEIYLGDGSSLEFLQFQREPNEVFQFVTNRFFLKKESVLRVRQFVRGGAVTRNENEVCFLGARAEATLKGLSVLSGESQVYQHAVVRHEVGDCTSRQFYKNILADASKSEFNSLVAVEKDAAGSHSQQLNRNLLMSDFAQAFSRPQLRINADDVQCTHGATVGQIEKDELFYLRSRGLSEKEARFVLTYGFAHEFVEEITSPLLRSQMEKLVSEELERVIKGNGNVG